METMCYLILRGFIQSIGAHAHDVIGSFQHKLWDVMKILKIILGPNGANLIEKGEMRRKCDKKGSKKINLADI